ncbi:MAG: tetratricopeptide repeat protein [Ignavibacteria bacterium]|nr:tetratricopeptide repeat protein [Ignavibacteria bacterium]
MMPRHCCFIAAELDAISAPQAEALANNSRGLALYIQGDRPAALSHYHGALALYEELGDRGGVAAVSSRIGVVNNRIGNYTEALSHFHLALAILLELDDRKGVAGVTGNIGTLHWRTGNYPEALSHYHRALALSEELGDLRLFATLWPSMKSLQPQAGARHVLHRYCAQRHRRLPRCTESLPPCPGAP